jgi:hypothetical protein
MGTMPSSQASCLNFDAAAVGLPQCRPQDEHQQERGPGELAAGLEGPTGAAQLIALHKYSLHWTSDMRRLLGRRSARCWRSVAAVSAGCVGSRIAWCDT